MSMSVARTTVSSVRALHTSSRLLADQSPSSTSTAASLGFSDYSNRTRKLPSIPIAPSSKQNLLRPRTSNPKTGVNADTKNPISPRDGGGQGRDPRSAKRHPGEYGTEQERQRRKRQDRSPVQASLNKARQDRQQSTGDGEGGDEFFVATPSRGRGNAGAGGKGNKMKKVDLDLDSVNVNVNVPSVRARTPRGSSSNDKRTKSAAPRVKEKRVAEVEDRSPAGIFGRMSLLLPVRRGAREAERSVWADGLKPDQGQYQSQPLAISIHSLLVLVLR